MNVYLPTSGGVSAAESKAILSYAQHSSESGMCTGDHTDNPSARSVCDQNTVDFEVHTAFSHCRYTHEQNSAYRNLSTMILKPREFVELTFFEQFIVGKVRVFTASGSVAQRSFLIGRNGCAREITKRRAKRCEFT